MAPRTTASRSARYALAAVLITVAAWAPAAVAQEGNGLYEPFPEAAVKKRAQRYVERLGDRTPDPGRRYSDRDLARGAFVRPGPAAPTLSPPAATELRGAASARAGADAAEDVALPLQLILLALALILPATALMTRVRTRAV